ncbi:MAG TPA: endolytic transglycosylase MltG [Candidatus Saccharimonadales bacterium]|nr:endolytic transglycosylase MltG [Candidatus Saccharimonadales bacterium]
MKYSNRRLRRRWPRRLVIVAIIAAVVVAGATAAVRYVYNQNLRPVSSSQTVQSITVPQGATVEEIGSLLQQRGLIRSAWAFKLYVSSKEVRNALQAGTYELAPSQGVAEIVSQLTHGKIVTNLVTILPGQRIDQIRTRLIQDGFLEADVDQALDPNTYVGHPALVDKPKGAGLEGYLYPDSFQRTSETSAKTIVGAALDEMDKQLTPDIRAAFSRQGLSTYQGIILASIVEREVSEPNDRPQVAQVFLKRLRIGMPLQSDATAHYGAILEGAKPSTKYDSVYNTYTHKGLTPTPISNVSSGSLQAVANPASTDWLYFVSGDDGTTHFSKTLTEHEAKVRQYCKENCAQ